MNATAMNSCSAIAGSVTNNTDCDDTDGAINPDATEVCDGIDNNCDGSIDEGLALNTYYADTDNDGYGDIGSTTEVCDANARWHNRGWLCCSKFGFLGM